MKQKLDFIKFPWALAGPWPGPQYEFPPKTTPPGPPRGKGKQK